MMTAEAKKTKTMEDKPNSCGGATPKSGKPIVESDSSAPYDTSGDRTASDTDRLLGIFPEEIWRIILEKTADDPSVLKNISNASLFFRNCILDQRTSFLFPNVWKFLEPQLTNNCQEEYKKNFSPGPARSEAQYLKFTNDHCTKCLSCGTERHPRPYSIIWKLRLVCKSWSTAVDNFYQTHPLHSLLIDEVNPDYQEYLGWMKEEFGEFKSGVEDISDNFKLHFEGTHTSGGGMERSPFIGRSASFDHDLFDEWYQDEEDPPTLIPILEKYGHHIWTCKKIKISESISGYLKLATSLNSMPNLRILRIDCMSRFEGPAADLVTALEVNEELKNVPRLKNLKFLQTSDLASEVFNELIKKNNHLSTLEMVRRSDTTEDYDLFNLPMPNLTKLFIELYDNEAEFRQLEMSPVTWPLTKLHLCLDIDIEESSFLAWSRIVTVINTKWANTLTDLTIRFAEAKEEDDERRILEECSSLKLEAPRMKRLKLIIRNYTSLDFILPMKESLEMLDVRFNWDLDRVQKLDLAEKVKKEQIIQILGYHKRMLDSSIWELFPKLKKIEICEWFDPDTGREYKTPDIRAREGIESRGLDHCMNWSFKRDEWRDANKMMDQN